MVKLAEKLVLLKSQSPLQKFSSPAFTIPDKKMKCRVPVHFNVLNLALCVWLSFLSQLFACVFLYMCVCAGFSWSPRFGVAVKCCPLARSWPLRRLLSLAQAAVSAALIPPASPLTVLCQHHRHCDTPTPPASLCPSPLLHFSALSAKSEREMLLWCVQTHSWVSLSLSLSLSLCVCVCLAATLLFLLPLLLK